MNIRFRLLSILGFVVALSGCGDDGPAQPSDGRPSGTVLIVVPLSEQCEIDSETKGYLYDGIPNIGGNVIETQTISDRKFRFYLPPSSGLYWLVVKRGDTELAETSFQTSDRDLEYDPPLTCN